MLDSEELASAGAEHDQTYFVGAGFGSLVDSFASDSIRGVPRAAAILIALLPGIVAPGPRQPTPPVQAELDRKALAARVREETLAAWRAYESQAWGHDELKPVSGTAKDWYDGQSLLMTPVDSLDTLLLMGLNEEAGRAKALILEKLSFDKDIFVKNFEITIRLLGGLLSGYQMTGDERLLAPGRRSGHAAASGFRFPDRHALHLRQPEDREDEGRAIQSRRDRDARSSSSARSRS